MNNNRPTINSGNIDAINELLNTFQRVAFDSNNQLLGWSTYNLNSELGTVDVIYHTDSQAIEVSRPNSSPVLLVIEAYRIQTHVELLETIRGRMIDLYHGENYS